MIDKKTREALIPGGFDPQIWKRVSDCVNEMILLEGEISEEQSRNFDMGFALHIALYEGFVQGLGYVADYANLIARSDETSVPLERMDLSMQAEWVKNGCNYEQPKLEVVK